MKKNIKSNRYLNNKRQQNVRKDGLDAFKLVEAKKGLMFKEGSNLKIRRRRKSSEIIINTKKTRSQVSRVNASLISNPRRKENNNRKIQDGMNYDLNQIKWKQNEWFR